MKIRLLIAILLMTAGFAHAQGHVNIDTVHLGGLNLDTRAADIAVFAGCSIDTMLWGGKEGASMFGFKHIFLSQPGEIRVATEKGFVSQLTFVAATKSAGEAAIDYKQLSAKMEKKYGDPDEVYANKYRFLTWHGKKYQLSVKTMDASNYLVVTLTKEETVKSVPSRIR